MWFFGNKWKESLTNFPVLLENKIGLFITCLYVLLPWIYGHIVYMAEVGVLTRLHKLVNKVHMFWLESKDIKRRIISNNLFSEQKKPHDGHHIKKYSSVQFQYTNTFPPFHKLAD